MPHCAPAYVRVSTSWKTLHVAPWRLRWSIADYLHTLPAARWHRHSQIVACPVFPVVVHISGGFYLFCLCNVKWLLCVVLGCVVCRVSGYSLSKVRLPSESNRYVNPLVLRNLKNFTTNIGHVAPDTVVMRHYVCRSAQWRHVCLIIIPVTTLLHPLFLSAQGFPIFSFLTCLFNISFINNSIPPPTLLILPPTWPQSVEFSKFWFHLC